jgi:hypothetical protein
VPAWSTPISAACRGRTLCLPYFKAATVPIQSTWSTFSCPMAIASPLLSTPGRFAVTPASGGHKNRNRRIRWLGTFLLHCLWRWTQEPGTRKILDTVHLSPACAKHMSPKSRFSGAKRVSPADGGMPAGSSAQQNTAHCPPLAGVNRRQPIRGWSFGLGGATQGSPLQPEGNRTCPLPATRVRGAGRKKPQPFPQK